MLRQASKPDWCFTPGRILHAKSYDGWTNCVDFDRNFESGAGILDHGIFLPHILKDTVMSEFVPSQMD